MIVSTLLKQPCNKSDSLIKLIIKATIPVIFLYNDISQGENGNRPIVKTCVWMYVLIQISVITLTSSFIASQSLLYLTFLITGMAKGGVCASERWQWENVRSGMPPSENFDHFHPFNLTISSGIVPATWHKKWKHNCQQLVNRLVRTSRQVHKHVFMWL